MLPSIQSNSQTPGVNGKSSVEFLQMHPFGPGLSWTKLPMPSTDIMMLLLSRQQNPENQRTILAIYMLIILLTL